MDNESVMEFLGGVPLLQRLPSTSLGKISQQLTFKQFEKGEYVIREGEAEAAGSLHAKEDTRRKFQFKRYDHFGYGISTSFQHADVIALTRLSCLVLPREYCDLHWPKSICSANKAGDSCSLMEGILHLEPIEVNIFQGITLPEVPKFRMVFGGQFIGQALAAASKTVDCLKIVHSLHAYFLLAGDFDMPIIYEVHRVRDGKSFATRRVDATQRGNVVFTLVASFEKEEQGYDHQIVTMPSVPEPEMLQSIEELRERHLTDPLLPRSYRNEVASKNFIPWPMEIRLCEPPTGTNQTKSPPSMKYWFRVRGKLSDDQALHRCVAAYTSDLFFIEVSLNPHRTRELETAGISLDHSMWFHRPFRADDWLLYVMESPAAHGGRGFVAGQMFNRKGEHVASTTQEGLVRQFASPKPPTTSSKL